MLAPEDKKLLSESEDMKLAADGLRAVFRPDGQIQQKHHKALDAIARFCKVNSYNHGVDQVEINRMTGRREVYNFIMFCLEYPAEERRKLIAQITQLEEVRDGRQPADDT